MLEASTAQNERLRRLVPGGAHTYARGEDQYPEGLAPVIRDGRGCRVWDVDGNEYVEYGSGLRSVVLGHAHPDVVSAVTVSVQHGQNFVRPHQYEAVAAERMIELIDSADMVKFGLNGSDATTAAIRLARAATGRDLVARCADHPFFSVDDWFIGTTEMDAGIPRPARESTLSFRYNDAASLAELFESRPGQFAAVILEAQNTTPPAPGFLQEVRELCDRHGVVMVLDEIITGFRWDLKGAQHRFGIRPDLSTFAKAMANGFPCSALVGRRDLMQLGGWDHDRDRVFLLSQTYGALPMSLHAFLATSKVIEEQDVPAQLARTGNLLRSAIERMTAELGIQDHFQLVGDPAGLVYVTKDADGNRSQEFRTLFLQETISRGLLAHNLFVSAAHDSIAIERTLEAVSAALVTYRKALEDGIGPLLHGRPVKPALRRRA